jgi:hypothetical protein
MSEPECIYNIDKIKDVDSTFTNSLLYWHKNVEKELIWLLPNMAKKSP